MTPFSAQSDILTTEPRRSGWNWAFLTSAVAHSSSLCVPSSLLMERCLISEVPLSTKANTQALPGTHAGLSSRMSAVVESGSKSRFFLTFCFGEGGLLARPAWSSYSWDKDTRVTAGLPALT